MAAQESKRESAGAHAHNNFALVQRALTDLVPSAADVGNIVAHPDRHDVELDLQKRLRPYARLHSITREDCVVVDAHGRSRHNLQTVAGRSFARYSYHSLNTWQNLARAGGSAQIDGKQWYLNLASRSGLYLVEVAALTIAQSRSKDFDRSSSLGFMLFTVDKNSITDLALFPKEIQSHEKLLRLNEILVIPSSLGFHPGLISRYLFHELRSSEQGKGRVELTRIVSEPVELAYHWSINSLRRHGYREITRYVDPAGVVYNPASNDRVSLTVPSPRANLGIKGSSTETICIKDGLFIFDPTKPSSEFNERDENEARIAEHIDEQFSSIGNFRRNGRAVGLWSYTYDNLEDYAVARRLDGNQIFAVELNPREKRPYRYNLIHLDGTDTNQVLPRESLDSIICSSVLGKVIGDGAHAEDSSSIERSNDFKSQMVNFISSITGMLKPDGQICFRTQLVPEEWSSTVTLELKESSDADRFLDYTESAYRGAGIEFERISQHRFIVSREEAYKFLYNILPYQDSDKVELDQAAPLLTVSQLIHLLRQNGIRIHSALQINNHHVRHSVFDGTRSIFDSTGTIQFGSPPNMYEIFGEKVVDASAPVRVERVGDVKPSEQHYLQHTYYQNIFDEARTHHLITRGHQQIYGLFVVQNLGDEPSVLIRQKFPRPLRNVMFNCTGSDDLARDFPLDGSLRSGYSTESCFLIPKEGETISQAIRRVLHTDFQIPDSISCALGNLDQYVGEDSHFPSTGAVNETWRDIVISELPPQSISDTIDVRHEGFQTENPMQLLPLQDIVSFTRGSAPASTNLVNFAYEYLLDNGYQLRSMNSEIGLVDQYPVSIECTPASESHFKQTKENPAWKRVDAEPDSYSKFFDLMQGDFAEFNSSGEQLADQQGNPIAVRLEFATVSERTGLTNNTIVFTPVFKHNGEYLVCLENRENDLPLIEAELGLTKPEVLPAYRVPKDWAAFYQGELVGKMITKFEEHSGVRVRLHPTSGNKAWWSIAPEYLVCGGCLPERSYHVLVEVDAASLANSNLRAFKVSELISNRKMLFCEHTRAGVYRAAHLLNALGRVGSRFSI